MVNLTELFEYDLWANLRWLETLSSSGLPEQQMAVLSHMLGAQEIWLQRCQGKPPTIFPSIQPTAERMAELSAEWRSEVAAGDRDIDYRRLNGEPMKSRLSDIAMHVIHHGTYHRGELRGLARARGDDRFPETDFILFALERG